MDDVRAVMDAAGSERAVLVGFESGFAVAAMFAATFPERTAGLVSFGAKARELWAPDYPFGRTAEEFDGELEEYFEQGWGTFALAQDWVSVLDPEAADDPREIQDFVGWMQSIGGPGDAVRWSTMGIRDIDLRDVPSSIRTRRSYCTGWTTWELRSSTVVTRRSTSRGPSCGRCPGPRTCGATAKTSRWRSSAS